MPPSVDESPATECPPPRIAAISPLSRAKFTASTTSAVPVQLATRAGSPSCMALNSGRTAA